MRRAALSRSTSETSVELALDLDGTGRAEIETGVGFLDHMLHLLARHSLIDLKIKAVGDYHIDDHHTVEDIGIVLGRAFKEALGEKRGITRYGDCLLPMDEALTRVAVDVSGRAFLVFNVPFSAPKIGTFDTELVREFFQAFATNASITLHVDTLHGLNNHHLAEGAFKGLARAIRKAIALDPREGESVPSSKGSLSV